MEHRDLSEVEKATIKGDLTKINRILRLRSERHYHVPLVVFARSEESPVKGLIAKFEKPFFLFSGRLISYREMLLLSFGNYINKISNNRSSNLFTKEEIESSCTQKILESCYLYDENLSDLSTFFIGNMLRYYSRELDSSSVVKFPSNVIENGKKILKESRSLKVKGKPCTVDNICENLNIDFYHALDFMRSTSHVLYSEELIGFDVSDNSKHYDQINEEIDFRQIVSSLENEDVDFLNNLLDITYHESCVIKFAYKENFSWGWQTKLSSFSLEILGKTLSKARIGQLFNSGIVKIRKHCAA